MKTHCSIKWLLSLNNIHCIHTQQCIIQLYMFAISTWAKHNLFISVETILCSIAYISVSKLDRNVPIELSVEHGKWASLKIATSASTVTFRAVLGVLDYFRTEWKKNGSNLAAYQFLDKCKNLPDSLLNRFWKIISEGFLIHLFQCSPMLSFPSSRRLATAVLKKASSFATIRSVSEIGEPSTLYGWSLVADNVIHPDRTQTKSQIFCEKRSFFDENMSSPMLSNARPLRRTLAADAVFQSLKMSS